MTCICTKSTGEGSFLSITLNLTPGTGVSLVFRNIPLCWNMFWCGMVDLLNLSKESSGASDEIQGILKGYQQVFTVYPEMVLRTHSF